jgi:hypothetical protein
MSAMIRALALALILPALFAACGESQSKPDRPRTVDVAALTIEQVRENALAAIHADGKVFHLTTTSEVRGQEFVQEVWVDDERDLARAEFGDELRVVHERRMAMLFQGRFHDGPIDSPAEKVAPLELSHIRWLFDDTADVDAIEESTVDGEPAIRVRLTRDMYDYDARETNEIDLSESFLPLRAKGSSTLDAFPEGSAIYEYEFISRDTLSPTFFSPDDVRAAAGPLVQPLTDARDAGMTPYWLGERFEDIVLRDESRFDPGSDDDDEPAALRLHYRAPGQVVAPSPCITIAEFQRDDWEARMDRIRDEFPESPVLRDPGETIDVPAGAAQIFVGAPPPALATPSIGAPVVTPDPDAVPPPGAPPPLPVVPEDTGAPLEARIVLDSTVIEVNTNCGPPGSNLYRTRDAFLRVLQALQPFAGP